MANPPRRVCIVADCREPVGPGENRARCNPHRLELDHARRIHAVLSRMRFPLAHRIVDEVVVPELLRLRDQSHRTRLVRQRQGVTRT